MHHPNNSVEGQLVNETWVTTKCTNRGDDKMHQHAVKTFPKQRTNKHTHTHTQSEVSGISNTNENVSDQGKRYNINSWRKFAHRERKAQFNKHAEWCFVQLNARSLTRADKRQTIDKWANHHKVDAMMFHEGKVNSNCIMESKKYICFFSSGVKNEDRDKSEKLKKNSQRIPNELKNATAEHRGVCVALYKGYKGLIENVEALGDRMIHICLRSRNQLHLVAAYAPTSPAETQEKEQFYERFENQVLQKYLSTK